MKHNKAPGSDGFFLLCASREEAGVLKNILCMFEHLSGFKINFNKSEFFCFGEPRDNLEMYVQRDFYLYW